MQACFSVVASCLTVRLTGESRPLPSGSAYRLLRLRYNAIDTGSPGRSVERGYRGGERRRLCLEEL